MVQAPAITADDQSFEAQLGRIGLVFDMPVGTPSSTSHSDTQPPCTRVRGPSPKVTFDTAFSRMCPPRWVPTLGRVGIAIGNRDVATTSPRFLA